MEEQQLQDIMKRQRAFFDSGATKSVKYRKEALNKLANAITEYTDEICEAIRKDLNKGTYESYMCEVGLVLSEIRYMIRHIDRFSRDKRVYTPISQFAARSFISPMPYGIVLIMSPWNYPFMLTMEPLVSAIAAGNTVILKPSDYSKATSEMIYKLIQRIYPSNYVAVVTGGRQENGYLLKQKFDYIFFTGGVQVGKIVMEHAAKYLTPVTLELGGKSPCIVDRSANIKLAAKRIVFGKFLNCGQTCVAPDYIYCDEKIKDKLLDEIKNQICYQYTDYAINQHDYGKIINKKHFDRLIGLLDQTKIVFGGKTKEETLQIEPTVMDHVTFEDAVMQEEIFGPILPVITYHNLGEAVKKIKSLPHPLAFYIFSTDKRAINYVLKNCQFGGGCINDTIVHLTTSNLPFGGVGESGMGSYHGKKGFDTFTHYRSILDKKNWIDLPVRYRPYKNLNLLRTFFK